MRAWARNEENERSWTSNARNRTTWTSNQENDWSWDVRARSLTAPYLREACTPPASFNSYRTLLQHAHRSVCVEEGDCLEQILDLVGDPTVRLHQTDPTANIGWAVGLHRDAVGKRRHLELKINALDVTLLSEGELEEYRLDEA